MWPPAPAGPGRAFRSGTPRRSTPGYRDGAGSALTGVLIPDRGLPRRPPQSLPASLSRSSRRDGQLGERGLARHPVNRGTDLGLHPCPGFIDERQQRLRHAEKAHGCSRYAIEALLAGSIENLKRIKRFQSLCLGARHEIPIDQLPVAPCPYPAVRTLSSGCASAVARSTAKPLAKRKAQLARALTCDAAALDRPSTSADHMTRLVLAGPGARRFSGNRPSCGGLPAGRMAGRFRPGGGPFLAV